MNQIFAGGIALIIAFWLFAKGKKPQFQSTSDPSYINNRPQSDTSFVEIYSPQEKLGKSASENILWSKPKKPRDKILLRKQLMKLMQAGPEERLQAIVIASRWGNSTILPILKRGLKDSDMRVMITAAEGIQKFKCSSKTTQTSLRPPRNVFLMR